MSISVRGGTRGREPAEEGPTRIAARTRPATRPRARTSPHRRDRRGDADGEPRRPAPLPGPATASTAAAASSIRRAAATARSEQGAAAHPRRESSSMSGQPLSWCARRPRRGARRRRHTVRDGPQRQRDDRGHRAEGHRVRRPRQRDDSAGRCRTTRRDARGDSARRGSHGERERDVTRARCALRASTRRIVSAPTACRPAVARVARRVDPVVAPPHRQLAGRKAAVTISDACRAGGQREGVAMTFRAPGRSGLRPDELRRGHPCSLPAAREGGAVIRSTTRALRRPRRPLVARGASSRCCTG